MSEHGRCILCDRDFSLTAAAVERARAEAYEDAAKIADAAGSALGIGPRIAAAIRARTSAPAGRENENGGAVVLGSDFQVSVSTSAQAGISDAAPDLPPPVAAAPPAEGPRDVHPAYRISIGEPDRFSIHLSMAALRAALEAHDAVNPAPPSEGPLGGDYTAREARTRVALRACRDALENAPRGRATAIALADAALAPPPEPRGEVCPRCLGASRYDKAGKFMRCDACNAPPPDTARAAEPR